MGSGRLHKKGHSAMNWNRMTCHGMTLGHEWDASKLFPIFFFTSCNRSAVGGVARPDASLRAP